MNRTRRAIAAVSITACAISACADDEGASPMTTTTTSASSTLDVNGTTLHVDRRGHGAPLLIIHGGGEDAAMLDAQADDLARAGHDVVTYDRRGTGRSGRDDWPGGGAHQHADDAAGLIEALGWTTPTVLGVSSGGVIALDLATRHPDRVGTVVAWEPPAAGNLPGGADATAALMAPVEAHLAEHPGDFVGAQAILLTAVLGFPVTRDDAAFAPTRANAEPFVRDEPAITTTRVDESTLSGADVVIAIGSHPNDLIAAAADVLTDILDRPAIEVDADHEVYLTDPAILTEIVATTTASSGRGDP